MPRYLDIDGDSNIRSYEIGDTWIEVTFRDGSVYTYTSQSAGADNIEKMKHLAHAGEGLNSFIQRRVRRRYAHKR